MAVRLYVTPTSLRQKPADDLYGFTLVGDVSDAEFAAFKARLSSAEREVTVEVPASTRDAAEGTLRQMLRECGIQVEEQKSAT